MLEGLLAAAVTGAFRFYFLGVMQKYHEEGVAAGHAHPFTAASQPMAVAYAQPTMVMQPVAMPGYAAQPVGQQMPTTAQPAYST